MFPLHLRFAETCYAKSWRFDQVSVMFSERKCQVMFPSYLSEDVSAVVPFRYVSAKGFLISLFNLCNENKPIMVLCMVFTIFYKASSGTPFEP